jgi:hypothetical protein
VKLYRLMKADSDGKPLVGSGSMMLGVRPTDPAQPNKRADVPAVAGTDVIHPGDGGLSCYSDPDAIKIQSNRLELWSIEVSDLPPELSPQDAGDPHYHVEPKRDVTLDQLQRLLADTRDRWQQEKRGTTP